VVRKHAVVGAFSVACLLLAPMTAAPAAAAPARAAAAVGDADRMAARQLLEQMIRIRTVKGEGQVPTLIDAIRAHLVDAGFSADDILAVPVEIDGEQTAGLLVRYRPARPTDRKPIALLAHMDVVGAVPESWSTDPFEPVEKDGYLHGRGAADNKSGVALLVSSFARLKRAGWTPDRELILALSGDEETGMLTTKALARHPWVSNAEYALNADAGIGAIDRGGGNPSFAIQSAEKTTATFRLTARNPGGHSSTPRADNALFDIADAIVRLRALRFPVDLNEITRDMVADLADKNPGAYGDALRRLLADPEDAAARAVAEKQVESHLLWTTCVPTMIQGGNAPNALPSTVTLTVNCRIMPGTPVAQVEQQIKAAVANPELTLERAGPITESPISPANPAVFAALRRAVHAGYPGAPVRPTMSSGGTDGREWRSVGIPTYGAGSLALIRGEESNAHGANERLPLMSFDKELTFWDVLLRDIGSTGGKERGR
jgi:carboxypeptidase PM20D1